MLTRRQLLWAGGALALVTPFSGFSMTDERTARQPIFRFGVVADPQYAPIAPSGTRYYSNSLRKLNQAIKVFNEETLEFIVTLGTGAAMRTFYRSTERWSVRTSFCSATTISTSAAVT
jgi:hypothetical protein